MTEAELEELAPFRDVEVELAELHLSCADALEGTQRLVRFEVEQEILDANEGLLLKIAEDRGA